VETFFRDTKQDLGFGDCELRYAAGASRRWHLLMLAYSFLKLGASPVPWLLWYARTLTRRSIDE